MIEVSKPGATAPAEQASPAAQAQQVLTDLMRAGRLLLNVMFFGFWAAWLGLRLCPHALLYLAELQGIPVPPEAWTMPGPSWLTL